MEHKLINPLSEIKISGKNREQIEGLMTKFNDLSSDEKLDVIELQNLMLDFASRHNKEYGIPTSTTRVERTPNVIINKMSAKSLDYSQMCLKYYVSQIENKKPQVKSTV